MATPTGAAGFPQYTMQGQPPVMRAPVARQPLQQMQPQAVFSPQGNLYGQPLPRPMIPNSPIRGPVFSPPMQQALPRPQMAMPPMAFPQANQPLPRPMIPNSPIRGPVFSPPMQQALPRPPQMAMPPMAFPQASQALPRPPIPSTPILGPVFSPPMQQALPRPPQAAMPPLAFPQANQPLTRPPTPNSPIRGPVFSPPMQPRIPNPMGTLPGLPPVNGQLPPPTFGPLPGIAAPPRPSAIIRPVQPAYPQYPQAQMPSNLPFRPISPQTYPPLSQQQMQPSPPLNQQPIPPQRNLPPQQPLQQGPPAQPVPPSQPPPSNPLPGQQPNTLLDNGGLTNDEIRRLNEGLNNTDASVRMNTATDLLLLLQNKPMVLDNPHYKQYIDPLVEKALADQDLGVRTIAETIFQSVDYKQPTHAMKSRLHHLASRANSDLSATINEPSAAHDILSRFSKPEDPNGVSGYPNIPPGVAYNPEALSQEQPAQKTSGGFLRRFLPSWLGRRRQPQVIPQAAPEQNKFGPTAPITQQAGLPPLPPDNTPNNFR
ncbi:MAG: hypothetical protein AAGI66_02755 [Cyanobacteria bacterium P01_H01_bin.74]